MIDLSTKAKFDAAKTSDAVELLHVQTLPDGTEIQQLRLNEAGDISEACYRKLPGDQWRKQAGLLL